MKFDRDLPDIFKVKWCHHAARSGLTFTMSYVHLSGYIKYYPFFIGERYQYVIGLSEGPDWLMWRNEQDVTLLRQRLAERCQNFRFVRHCFEKIIRSMHEYKKFGDNIKGINYSALNRRQLIRLYKEYLENMPLGTIAASTIIELASGLGLKLENKITGKIKEEKERENIMMILGAPVENTLPLEEELDFLRLLIKIGKKDINRLMPVFLKSLKNHFLKYRWLTVYFGGKPWIWPDFMKRLKNAQEKGGIKERLIKLKFGHREIEKKTNLFIKKFQLNSQEISLLKEIMFWRIQIENFYSYVNFQAMGLQREIAKRMTLSLNQLNFLLPQEIEEAFTARKPFLLGKISERQKYYLMVIGKSRVHFFAGRLGKKVFLKLLKETVITKQTREIKGICGQAGQARGKVRVIVKINDIIKMREGEILVTQNTTPIFVPAMKKAVAIVTDEGGITCHAAIVSRELGIPCVIGTKIATKVLKDGDRVEVEAAKGIVKKI